MTPSSTRPALAHTRGSTVLLATTLGRCVGGARGGCAGARGDVIARLRQRSWLCVFSNPLPPVVVGVTLPAFEILGASTELRDRLEVNTRNFRERMSSAGFEIRPGSHPIVPILFSRFTPDAAALAHLFARALLAERTSVKGVSFPVVPSRRS